MNLIKYLISIVICSLLATKSIAQYRHDHKQGTYFYFSKYNFYLSTDSINTSLKYLGKLTDVENLSHATSETPYRFASFIVNKKDKTIAVNLYDTDSNLKQMEKYSFTNNIKSQNDTLFYNLSMESVIETWNVILTNLDK